METLIAIISIVAVIVFFMIAGWVEKIKKYMRIQAVETIASRMIISKIAEKNGVTVDEIQRILDVASGTVK